MSSDLSYSMMKQDIDGDDPTRIPPPSHRHATPSAPWPWVDIRDKVDPVQLASPLPPIPPLCEHKDCSGCWRNYPQSRFPNWTKNQVVKAKIWHAINRYRKDLKCTLLQVDVDDKGIFTNAGEIDALEGEENNTWEKLVHGKLPSNIRVRAVFIENMSGPILQMLGAKYNIEPFFFSSSLNWIPSRFQEDIRPKKGDHITVSLKFLRSTDNRISATPANNQARSTSDYSVSSKKSSDLLGTQKIDTQAPLGLFSNKQSLVLDLLSVHLIRSIDGSTIISYHSNDNPPTTTTARYLHERIRFAGQSVYWQSIFQKSPDPTFVLLTFIWHAIYAWDEALEKLYEHICSLETLVIKTTETKLTQELHVIRAHQLHYDSLLEDFSKTVIFVKDTRNPAMEGHSKETRNFSRSLLERESANLLGEVKRLQMELKMQDRRLKNVFNSVNIEDSRTMKELTTAAVRDSAAMKQVAYLTMIFLPASFVVGVFGMNIHEIVPDTHGSVAHYAEIAIPLTLVTIWTVMALQIEYILPRNFNGKKIETGILVRLWWPYYLVKYRYILKKEEEGRLLV